MSDKTTAEDVRAILAEEEQNAPEEVEADQPEKETEEAPQEAEKSEEDAPEGEEAEPEQEPKEETVEDKAKPTRRSKYVPVNKYNSLRHEAAEAKAKAAALEAELQKAKEEGSKANLESTAEKIAKEHDVSADAVKAILEATLASRPNKELEEIKSLKASIMDQAEEAQYQKELGETIKKYPELQGYESDLRELAYSEGNEKVPLRLLALQLREELNLSPKPPSGERTAAKPKPSQNKDFGSMSESELMALEGKDLDEFIKWQSQGFKARSRKV